jgi:hypothetical protein
MDTTLVTVTVLSMGMAAALSVIVWRMLRLEHQRTNARVASLRLAARTAEPEREVLQDAVADLPILGTAAAATSGALFVERERPSPWAARLGVMTALALIGASIFLFALSARARARAPHPAAPATRATQAAASIPAGLELLSLRDSRQAGTLTITGLVQNPRGGMPMSRVSVAAYAFDDAGAFLASGRALLDVTALAPGDESPFVVTVPVTDSVARYRIGFRDDAGRVIAHVDRRQSGPVAANWSRP